MPRFLFSLSLRTLNYRRLVAQTLLTRYSIFGSVVDILCVILGAYEYNQRFV